MPPIQRSTKNNKMNSLHQYILIASTSFILFSAAAAQKILLLAKPASNAAIIARVDASNNAILSASSISSELLPASTWKQTNSPILIQGYLTKNSLLQIDSTKQSIPIREKPMDSAEIVVTAQKNDQYTLLNSLDENWTLVEIEKKTTAYFTEVAQLGLKSLNDTASNFSDNTYLSQEDEQVEAREIIVDTSNKTSIRQSPNRPKWANKAPTRTLSGTLVRRLRNYGPRYPLRLRAANGRIAYVDMSKLFFSDLRPYLDKKVSISGEVRPLVPGSTELVIQARSLILAK